MTVLAARTRFELADEYYDPQGALTRTYRGPEDLIVIYGTFDSDAGNRLHVTIVREGSRPDDDDISEVIDAFGLHGASLYLIYGCDPDCVHLIERAWPRKARA